jgi:hypothetical protein
MAFEKDDLERAKFADLLIDLTVGLVSATVLPSGRVISVDAPWGSGKSWIAKQLPEHFAADKRIGKCVYVDAFEFDYHQDPFAVVTSSIIAGYSKDTAIVKNFKKAAIDIMKVTLPAIGRGIVETGINYIGVDEKIIESVQKAGEAASDKAITKMLDTFTKTTETTKAFKAKLEALVKTNEKEAPLVVVIDELDRCRPSFALEMLERVKHLFDIQNVVFIFFAHSPALHSAIRKTYGNEINPSEYLRKFIAITIGLPISNKSTYEKIDKVDFFRKFLNSQYPKTTSSTEHDDKFQRVLIEFSPIFKASYRDIENVMLLWQILRSKLKDLTFYSAYCLLIKIKDPEQFNALINGSIKAYHYELTRLGDPDEYETGYISHIRDMFLYAAEPDLYANAVNENAKKLRTNKSKQDNKDDLRFFGRTLSLLELEYLRL